MTSKFKIPETLSSGADPTHVSTRCSKAFERILVLTSQNPHWCQVEKEGPAATHFRIGLHWSKRAEPTHVGLVHDDRIACDALSRAVKQLAPHWALVSFVSPKDALTRIPEDPPDAVVIDVCEGGACGLECACTLSQRSGGLPIVIYTACPYRRAVLVALAAGASGYLVKPQTPQNIIRALVRALIGERTLCPTAQGRLYRDLRWSGTTTLSANLSRREQEVLACLMLGIDQKCIGGILGISTGTAHLHLVKAYKKLGVHSAEQALAAAFSLSNCAADCSNQTNCQRTVKRDT